MRARPSYTKCLASPVCCGWAVQVGRGPRDKVCLATALTRGIAMAPCSPHCPTRLRAASGIVTCTLFFSQPMARAPKSSSLTCPPNVWPHKSSSYIYIHIDRGWPAPVAQRKISSIPDAHALNWAAVKSRRDACKGEGCPLRQHLGPRPSGDRWKTGACHLSRKVSIESHAC